MKLTIDNLAGLGAIDYTSFLDRTVAPRVMRKLNQPSEFTCSLLAGETFVVPTRGARVALTTASGEFVFTGYLTQGPQREYLGLGEKGPVYRYNLVADSDEVLLDRKALPDRAAFVERTAGSAVQQLAQDLLPGGFDTSGVQDVDMLASHAVNTQKKFSEHAGEIAAAARGSYGAMNGALVLRPIGESSYPLEESDPDFSPAGLRLSSPQIAINDVTVLGLIEPQAYVRDYFVGDGVRLSFYLSQTPFQQSRQALINEKYAQSALDPTTWSVSDPSSAFSVVAHALQVNGGAGDGNTTVRFLERIELGGAVELQHGDVSITGPSQGVIGGLYNGAISNASCLAGFRVTPSGTASSIQALINGVAAGPVVATVAGHRYLLTTYLYAREVYRAEGRFHSSLHPAGHGLGGAGISSDVRVVLEVQDVDPTNPASMIAPATVLFDDILANAPGFCSYAPVNAANMQCNIAYTYVTRISTAEVRTALEDSAYSTQLVESQVEGGRCQIVSSTTLDFYPQYVPPVNTLIVASYRGAGRAVAELIDSASIAALENGADDGRRGIVRVVKSPSTRTQAECENAALALLDEAASSAWEGSYEIWSDFLPGGARDVFPGDSLAVNVPSRNAEFSAIVRNVGIEWADPANDRGMYTIEFANELAQPIALQEADSATAVPLQDLPVRLSKEQVGSYYLASLTNAQITQVTSTTVQIDVGTALPRECAVEVRAHDFGWGAGNDRNLIGRFSSRTFTLTRLARSQNYFMRLYDASSPPRYSRYAAALHVDYPYE
jgi:hypothetical protein